MNAHVMPPLGSTNASSRRIFAAKLGRPPGADPQSERSRKPWIAEGTSQRTYYRRKAARTLDVAPPPVQHAAHVADWFATLSGIARLKHRALVRRDISAAIRPDARHPILHLYATSARAD